MKRIFVTGFPHSGTSIIKSKLGEGFNVYEQIEESIYPKDIEKYILSKKEFYLWKRPFLSQPQKSPTNFILEKSFKYKNKSYFKDDDIVFIMRNPYFLFSSIYEIFEKKFGECVATNTIIHNFNNEFTSVANLFLDSLENKYHKIFPIFYEKMFDDNFDELKIIMQNIGITYDDKIFESHTKTHTLINKFEDINKINSDIPEHYVGDPGYYRTWQINQPFSNFNDINKIKLPEKFIKLLDSSELLKKLNYSNPLN